MGYTAMVGYTSLRKNSRNIPERYTSQGSIKIWEGVSLKLILKDYGGNRQYVSLPFCWSLTWGLRVIIGGSRKWRRWIWNWGYRHLCTHLLEVEENFFQSLSAFWSPFLVIKRLVTKTPYLDTFHVVLLSSLH